MSLKQMSTQILSVGINEQPEYIDLQRMRARQIWDEVKHGQLHADVLLRGRFIWVGRGGTQIHLQPVEDPAVPQRGQDAGLPVDQRAVAVERDELDVFR